MRLTHKHTHIHTHTNTYTCIHTHTYTVSKSAKVSVDDVLHDLSIKSGHIDRQQRASDECESVYDDHARLSTTQAWYHNLLLVLVYIAVLHSRNAFSRTRSIGFLTYERTRTFSKRIRLLKKSMLRSTLRDEPRVALPSPLSRMTMTIGKEE